MKRFALIALATAAITTAGMFNAPSASATGRGEGENVCRPLPANVFETTGYAPNYNPNGVQPALCWAGGGIIVPA